MMVLFALGLLLVLPAVSAIGSDITIKTLPYREVIVFVAEPTDSYFQLIKKFNDTSGDDGEVTFYFEDGGYTEAKLTVQVREAKETVFKDESDIFEIGDPVVIELFPEGFKMGSGEEVVEVLNETGTEEVAQENDTEVMNETDTAEIADIEPGITGAAVTEELESGFDFTNYTWIIGLVLFIGAVGLVAMTKMRANASQNVPSSFSKVGSEKPSMVLKRESQYDKDVKIDNTSDKRDFKKQSAEELQKELEDAQKKIRDAQKEIEKIRDEEKIISAEKKLERDMKDLEELRKRRDQAKGN